MSRETTCLQNGPLRFYARHPALVDFAALLSEGIDPSLLAEQSSNPVNIFVGLHEFDKKKIDSSAMTIAIQTEQYHDERGKRLWGKPSLPYLVRQVLKYDRILELSEANRRAYRPLLALGLRKIRFGPHVFPDKSRVYSARTGSSLLFVGDVSNRRAEVLEKIRHEDGRAVTVLNGLYGAELRAAIGQGGDVLNIHYADGTYTEVPRILLAYMEGRVVYSEALSDPFVAKRHYVPIRDGGACDGVEAILDNISKDILPRHRFSQYLRDAGV